MSFLGPKDTVEVLNKSYPYNFYLRFQKFANYVKGISGGRFRIDKKIFNVKCRKLPEISRRHERNIQNFLDKYNYKSTALTLLPQWRFVIGLGSESVYEVSMTLHHIYGFPFIPGQAIKGVIRNYVILNYFDASEKKALEDEEFVYIFGNQKREGKVLFFDAYPDMWPTLQLDVMSPHYSPYYQDSTSKRFPVDYYNPIPVFFLTVKEGKFKFIFGSEKGDLSTLYIRKDNFKKIIEDTLKKNGIGAKTSVGYGYMKKAI